MLDHGAERTLEIGRRRSRIPHPQLGLKIRLHPDMIASASASRRRRGGQGTTRAPNRILRRVASAQELAADALAVANAFLEEQRDRLLERTEGDIHLLVEAARILRDEAGGGSSLEHSSEHLAFALLTAAFGAGRTRR